MTRWECLFSLTKKEGHYSKNENMLAQECCSECGCECKKTTHSEAMYVNENKTNDCNRRRKCEGSKKGLKSVDDMDYAWIVVFVRPWIFDCIESLIPLEFPFEIPFLSVILPKKIKGLFNSMDHIHVCRKYRIHFPDKEFSTHTKLEVKFHFRMKISFVMIFFTVHSKNFSVVILSCFPHVRICGCILFESR